MVANKVGMFVWNYFTNDARVLRECTALSEAGYHVDLIAVHQAGLPETEQRHANFHIHRMSRKFPFSQVIGWLKNRKYLLGLIALTYGIACFYWPPLLILLLISILLLTKPMRTLMFRSVVFLRMIRAGFRKRYDVYHANDLNTLLQAVICAKWLGRSKLIYDSHEVQTSRTGYDSPLYGIMERFLLRFVDVCIHENDTRAAYVKERYGFYPEVVHNYPFKQNYDETVSVDLHQQLGIPPQEPILLYQGGIQSGRGLDRLIEAAPHITTGTIVLIGDGRIKPELEKMVAERNLETRVKFMEKVALEVLPNHTRAAYIGFQLLNNTCFNHYSASSNKLFEYIMSGVPVIACDFPEISRVVKGYEVGLTVDSHDPAAIANAVNELVNQPEKRQNMHQNCLQAREIFNWEQEKPIFLAIYEKIAMRS
ncbi:glycosyltransferase family 4 protein [Listeria grandensis]|uniref:Glycosyltransferase family 4 protein n=1 Tax=Listeria grandensis TaxID=1494963 RepID=A0A7X0Y4Y0_9LIST|nr:glycosyltransferase [Listeria grandensis]MBC1937092.1 glycosyltransferase family 4 protein [Listeria grandensis]